MKSKKIDSIIHSAVKNVPFYMKRYGKIDGEDYEQIFSNMPILDKSYYIDRLDELVSLKCNKDSLQEEFTSGSTGKPLRCYKSLNDKIKIQSSIYYHRKKSNENFNVADFYLRLYGSWCEFNIEKNAILYSVFYFEKLEYYLEKIVNLQPKWILGTPSAILDFINKLKEIEKLDYFKEKVHLLFVEVTGEILSEFQRKYIESNLSTDVINHYGCREIWHVAFSCKYGNLHIAEDNVYVEVINEMGENILDEEGEIVLTSLNCYDIPFIRYRTGDIGKISRLKCKCGNTSPILYLSGGRTSEYLICDDGRRISSVLIHHIFRKVHSLGETGIESYYVRQIEVKKIEIYMNTNDKYNYEIEKYIQKLIREILGNIEVKFIYNINIPREKNGKMKFVKGIR